MKTATKRPAKFGEIRFRRVDGGFTLLEILLVMALIAVLLAGLNSIIRLFSGHYSSAERRVSRAQLSRSISQMLSDDLGSAVQDPILSLEDDPDRRFIRRFGLRGDSRSLQIDVVQPNLFATTATPDENRRVAEGGKKSSEARQVPELKTIFYEFVPINAFEKSDDKTAGELAPSTTDAASGENLGSELTGSLLGTRESTGENVNAGDFDALGSSVGGGLGGGEVASRPLARKFGLSRRELDFETPEDDASETAQEEIVEEDLESGNFGSHLGGSLSAPPDASKSTLASAGGGSNVATSGTALFENDRENEKPFEAPLTAAQIAMDADDGTTWAPEVLDCRFRYFDGEKWLDSWDSLEKEGLPIAIKVDLKLAPLDDVDIYRYSPLLFRLPVPPEPSEIAKQTAIGAVGTSVSGEFSSQVTGSLNLPGTTANANGLGATGKLGVDVFNSYRTLSSMQTAQSAPALPENDAFSTFRTDSGTSALAATNSTTISDSTGVAPTAAVAGALNGGAGATSENAGSLTGSALANESTGATSLDAAGSLTDLSSASGAASQAAARAAVFNGRGVCVDYANDGSYLTLEQMASELGLSEPTVCEVVAYLPTTPFGRTETLARRRPANVRRGTVAVRANGATRESTADRRTSGTNPYSTGRARQVQRRTPNDRSVAERSATSRAAATRGVENRTSATRDGASRRAATRAVENRGGSERAVANRQLRTRGAGGGDGGMNAELAAALDAEGGVLGAPVGGAEEFSGTEPVGGVGVPNASGLGSTSVGGLNVPATLGNVGSSGGLSPFDLVDSQNVPFSNGSGGFADVDAANGVDGTTFQPGLIETPSSGSATTVSPTQRGNSTPKKTQQTWIRGKK